MPLLINVGVQNLSSPTPDVFVNILTFKVLSDLLVCIERKKMTFQDIYLLAFYCLLGVVMKVSFLGVSFGILGVVIYYTYDKKIWKLGATLQGILLLLLLLLPWIARGIISTGYMVFPSSITGVPVDWKVPAAVMQSISDYIIGFARTLKHGPVATAAAHHYKWIPGWIKIMLHSVGFVVPVTLCFGTIVALKIKRVPVKLLVMILIPVFTSIIIWLLTAPTIRFAVFTFWSLGLLSLGYFIANINLKWTKGFTSFVVICSVVSMARNWNTEITPMGDLPKQFYSVFTTKSGIKINTIKNTPPGDDWQLGDCKIPCSVFPDSNLVLRGKDINSGFKISSAR